MVGFLKFSIEEALIPGVITQFVNILASLFVAATLPKVGGWSAMFYGLVLGACNLTGVKSARVQGRCHAVQRSPGTAQAASRSAQAV